MDAAGFIASRLQWIVFALGFFIGSFFNVLIYRLPRGEEVVVRPSHCPKCGARIRWHDNVPVISWFALGGKCRDCRGKISARYPVVEFFTAALLGVTVKLAMLAGYGIPAQIILAALAGILFLVLVIDFETYLIPDQLVWWGFALSIVLLVIGESPAGGWAAAAIGFFALSTFLIIAGMIGNAVVFPQTFKKEGGVLVIFPWLYYLITYIVMYPIEHFRGGAKASEDEILDAESATAEESAMGGGDIKLAALMGLMLGWKLLIAAFAAAIMTGGLVAIVMVIMKRVGGAYQKGLKLQFGPFLAAGAWVALFYGERMIAWYLRITGIGG